MRPQSLDSVCDSVRARIEDVVSSERCNVKARTSERQQVLGIAAGSGNVKTAFQAPLGVRHFNMARYDVGMSQGLAGPIKQAIRLWFIQNDIPHQKHVEVRVRQVALQIFI